MDTSEFSSKPKRARWISLGIAVFLCSQILIPASYYWNDEPTSERYSWRMFSSIDLSTWDTHVTALVDSNGKVVEQEIPLSATLQETYVKTVQRAQFDIVEQLMRQLSDSPGVSEVRFHAQGKFPSGKLMQPIRLSMKRGGPLLNESASAN